jgi:4-amino-4-deoxy-L-arabinose transferase-like glycosyltransferase
VSVRDPANPSARRGLRLRGLPRAAPRRPFYAGVRVSPASRFGVRRPSGYAWATIAATVAFIALTCWWLAQDRSIPIYDAGEHLETAFVFHQMLASGNVLGPFNFESSYPPFAFLIGALSVFVGGVTVSSPIIGENLVFVPLLTLGCYQTGRLLFGPRAGMLAAIFALGSDLLTAQFHVFMLDAPEAAVVAVSIWLLLACKDFSRVGLAATAGLVAGIGLSIKVQYPPFVMGIVLMALVRGGWRNWRGLLTFAVVTLIVGAPWYLAHLSQLSTFLEVSTANPIVVQGDVPPTFSLASFTWYFWSLLNSQLLLPLFTLLLAGTIWTIAKLVRERDGPRLEFFAGAFVAWIFITLTPSHDIRYGLPLLPYVAVIATGWIVYMPRAVRWAAIIVLLLGVSANTLGTTFGLGNTVKLALAHPPPSGEDLPDAVVLYSTSGFLVAGPSRDGDVPGLLAALKREGVKTVTWSGTRSTEPDFDNEGLLPLTRVAGLSASISAELEFISSSSTVTLVHLPAAVSGPPACTRLSDGTGVWVVRYDISAKELAYYCPTRHPRFYDVGGVG